MAAESEDKLRFERVRELFERASECSESQRESFLSNATIDDPRLADEVRALLQWADHDRKPLAIADFEMLREVGRGSQGTVFEAQGKDGKRVAIKVIASGLFGAGRDLKGRFDREHHALAAMSHPAIAKFYDAGVSDTGDLFLVMEFVDGPPLTQYCDRKRLSVRQRVELLCDICHGVEHAHAQQLLHRDLKPGNVHVTEVRGKPCAKILDFGLVKPLHAQALPVSFVSGPDEIVGTLEFMAPEQTRSKAVIDHRADVYALGAMLCELLTGEGPLERWQRGMSLLQQLRMIEDKEAVAPSELLRTSNRQQAVATERHCSVKGLRQQLRDRLDRIVLRCLHKQPAQRPPDVATLRLELEAWLRTGGWSSPWPWVLLLLVAALASWLLLGL